MKPHTLTYVHDFERNNIEHSLALLLICALAAFAVAQQTLVALVL